MKKIITLAVVTCCVSLFACGSTTNNSTPTEAVKTFYELLNAGDYETAAGWMYTETPEDHELVVGFLTELIGPEIKRQGGVTLSNIQEVPGKKAGEVRVTYDRTGKNGETEKDQNVCLRDAQGRWKIRPINN